MLPGFTADASLGGGSARARRFAATGDAGGIVPQQRLMTRSGRGGEQLGWSPTDPPSVCTCPCCALVHCGWLGLSTCMHCC